MKIGVCVKHVPGSAAAIKVKGDGSGIDDAQIKFEMSAYDAYAVEEAIKTKEKVGDSEVVVLTVGPKKAKDSLLGALAMGCDQAVHVVIEDGALMDSLPTAKLLAHQIKEEGIELLFTGRHAIDDDNAQVTQMLAEVLDWPHVMIVDEFILADDKASAKARRVIGGGAKEIVQVKLPGIFAATKGLNEPRYASLPGIMKAKKKPFKEVAASDTGLGEADLSAKVEWSNYEAPSEERRNKIFKDDPETAVAEVVKLLREEAKVI